MPTTTAHGIVIPAAGTEPADLYGVATRLGNSVEAAIAPGTWTAPTLTGTGPWANFGGTLQVAQYRLVGDRVEIRGTIKNGTIGTAAFTLPAGFRPPATILFGTESNGAYGRVSITAAGVVTPDIGNTASVSLDNIRFSITT